MPTTKGSNMRKRVARQREQMQVEDGRDKFYRRPTSDMLPDDVLLEIFNFYVDGANRVDGWRTLVHVCRRWRHVVFASPRRLHLRLLCTNKTPVKKLLDIWPELPLVIENRKHCKRMRGVTNIDAALKHNDRICQITIRSIPSPLLKRFAAMKKPFTALAHLHLGSADETAPIIPDSFLGGSAPRLRSLVLSRIPFPGLPKLLLSAGHLVNLQLWGIPHSAYISPEAMVTVLLSLPNLRSLVLVFRSPRPRPDPISRRPSALTRTVLPSLTHLRFKGVSEYLEVLISRTDLPLLITAHITFFNQLIFDIPLLSEFIRHKEALKGPHRALIEFNDNSVAAIFLSTTDPRFNLVLQISCMSLDWQLSFLAQAFSNLSLPLHTLDRLDIFSWLSSRWQDDIENAQLEWLEVLRPFINVKNLHLDKKLALRVAPALQELAREGATEVLPALQNIFILSLKSSGSVQDVQEAFAQFVAARQLLGHPVTMHDCRRTKDALPLVIVGPSPPKCSRIA